MMPFPLEQENEKWTILPLQHGETELQQESGEQSHTNTMIRLAFTSLSPITSLNVDAWHHGGKPFFWFKGMKEEAAIYPTLAI